MKLSYLLLLQLILYVVRVLCLDFFFQRNYREMNSSVGIAEDIQKMRTQSIVFPTTRLWDSVLNMWPGIITEIIPPLPTLARNSS